MTRTGYECEVRLISDHCPEARGRLVRAPEGQAHLLIIEDDPAQEGYATGEGIEYPQRERLIPSAAAEDYCIHPAIGAESELAASWLAAAALAGYRIVG